MHYYLLALQKYAIFSGRSTRSEYWYFHLINMGIYITLSILAAYDNDMSVLLGIYSLGIIIPSLAVGARRLHDIGKSGWMQLVSFIPLIGAIWLIVLFATESSPENNMYGPKNMVV